MGMSMPEFMKNEEWYTETKVDPFGDPINNPGHNNYIWALTDKAPDSVKKDFEEFVQAMNSDKDY